MTCERVPPRGPPAPSNVLCFDRFEFISMGDSHKQLAIQITNQRRTKIAVNKWIQCSNPRLAPDLAFGGIVKLAHNPLANWRFHVGIFTVCGSTDGFRTVYMELPGLHNQMERFYVFVSYRRDDPALL